MLIRIMLKKFCFIISILACVSCSVQEPRKIVFLKFQPDKTAQAVIAVVNQKNQPIKSLFCDDIVAKISGMKIKARLAYEKDKNFRMLYWSALGKESDIGSNDNLFWFWSRRMHPRGFYYASHADLSKTRLKTPFIPLWIMESLSVNVLPDIDYKVNQKDNLLMLSENRINALGEPTVKVTVIDKNTNLIIGHYCFDKKNQLEVSSEIIEFVKTKSGHEVPKKIKIQWFEENIFIDLELNNPETNMTLNPALWEMPDVPKKIRLGN